MESAVHEIIAYQLYRKMRFLEIPVDGPYKRSDIKMELLLSQHLSTSGKTAMTGKVDHSD